LINTGYVFDTKLLKKYAELFPEKAIKILTPKDFIQNFEELTTQEMQEVAGFLEFANTVLYDFKCEATVRKFKPLNIPTLYYMSKRMNFLRSAEKTKDMGDDLFGGIIQLFTEELKYSSGAELCFNYNHEVIRQLYKIESEEMKRLYIKILYVQALLLGHHPLNNKEMNILSNGLLTLLNTNLLNQKN